MKKRVVIFIGITILLIIVGGCTFLYFNKRPVKQVNEIAEKKIDLTEIKKKYKSYVKTNKVATLYKKENNKYTKKGMVEKDVAILLNTEKELVEGEDAKYFPLKDMNYYISYQDIEIIDAFELDKFYQNYILFNENVTTKENTKFYKEDHLVFTLTESIDLPIIIKDDSYYYVEYANQLLGVKKEEASIHSNGNNNQEIATSIAALNYHFFYDESNKAECQQIICHHVNQFESHLNYLKENNFYTLKMKDVELFVEGKIQLPKKSVLITIDDGWLAEKGIALLNKYQMNATVFLITSSYLPEGFTSEYVEAHSHGDNLHFSGACPGGQGGAIKCYEEEKLLKDLSLSREKLHGTTVFCYPFYEYNDYSISVLQKAGFTMAFVGGNKKISVGDNKMALTRYPILSTTTVNNLAKIVN